MTSTPAISINSPPTSSRPSLDSSVAASGRLSTDSLQSLASLPSQVGGGGGGGGGGTGTPGSIRTRGQPHPRRNRSALREFYGLKARQNDDITSAPSGSNLAIGLGVDIPDTSGPDSPGRLSTTSELDHPDFDPQSYAENLLATRDLRGLLAVENGLVNDVRGYDGERKSLVYDNYNKLIAATDTIRNMRSNMDPLTPATTTLLPAISHIASVSASLVETVHVHEKPSSTAASQAAAKRKATLQYVLATPERLQKLLDGGKRDEAESEWALVKKSVGQWKGVRKEDVDAFLKKGEEVMKS